MSFTKERERERELVGFYFWEFEILQTRKVKKKWFTKKIKGVGTGIGMAQLEDWKLVVGRGTELNRQEKGCRIGGWDGPASQSIWSKKDKANGMMDDIKNWRMEKWEKRKKCGYWLY